MSLRRPVRWREGMFLRPHHFQQWERFLESRESARLGALEPQAWGVVQSEIVEERLATFILELRSLRVVLPDGTYVDLPENTRLPARDFRGQMPQAGEPLTVSVGVRLLQDRVAQTQEGELSTEAARYSTVLDEVNDLDTGKDATTIETLALNARLFFGGEPTHGYVTVPVARLLRHTDPAKPVIVDSSFVPPALVLAGSPALHAMVRSAVSHLEVQLRALRSKLGSHDFDHTVLFQALSGCHPVLRDMVDDGLIHPRAVYRELARLVGTLLFRDTRGTAVESLPAYVHEDPLPAFQHLVSEVVRLTQVVVAERCFVDLMERSDRPAPSTYSVALRDQGREPGAQLFLEVGARESLARVPVMLMAARISSPGRLDTLQKFALPGLRTEPQADRPRGVPPSETGRFFRLRLEDGPEWVDGPLKEGSVSVLLLNAPPDVELKLVIVLPER